MNEITIEQAKQVIAEHRQAAERERRRRIEAKFGGKFFKVRNRYGEGSGPPPWWLYAHVERVDEFGYGHGLQFQDDGAQSIRIEPDSPLITLTSGSVGWQEITEQEFREAAKAVMDRIATLLTEDA